MTSDSLQRYIQAQDKDYSIALAEVKAGRKRSHWMWYIFPQLAGLGRSETARYYAIKNITEAEAYASHPVLGVRLRNISEVLLSLKDNDARAIMGSPDDLKLRSCATLFSLTAGADPVFQSILEKFFGGNRDEQTVALLVP